MGKKRRKYKKSSNFGLSIFLVLILIILMGYASFLLYSFAKSNGMLNFKDKDNNENENFEKNKEKLNFLSKLYSSSQENKQNKVNSENNDKITENNMQDIQKDIKQEEKIVVANPEKNADKKIDTKNVEKKVETKSNNENFKINSKDFTLYLAALNKDYDLYLTKKVEKIDYTDSPIFSIITFLINYKPKEPYLNLIPSGTKLLGAWIKNGILYLDFNKNFLNNKNGYKSVEIQIYQVVNTAMQFEEVKGVRFLIEGKTKKYFSDEGFLLDITFKTKQFPPSN